MADMERNYEKDYGFEIGDEYEEDDSVTEPDYDDDMEVSE